MQRISTIDDLLALKKCISNLDLRIDIGEMRSSQRFFEGNKSYDERMRDMYAPFLDHNTRQFERIPEKLEVSDKVADLLVEAFIYKAREIVQAHEKYDDVFKNLLFYSAAKIGGSIVTSNPTGVALAWARILYDTQILDHEEIRKSDVDKAIEFSNSGMAYILGSYFLENLSSHYLRRARWEVNYDIKAVAGPMGSGGSYRMYRIVTKPVGVGYEAIKHDSRISDRLTEGKYEELCSQNIWGRNLWK